MPDPAKARSEPPVLPPFAVLALAAGKSTRMKSRTPKALHPLLGKPLLRWVLDAARDAGAARIVVVVGHEAEAVKDALGTDYEYVLQSEQKGTGHAVQMARALLADWDGPLVVLPGDAPLLSADILRALLNEHHAANAAATLLTAVLDTDAGSYGRVVRDQNGGVTAIIEARDASPEQLQLREINASVYAFHPPTLFAALSQITPDNAQGELYLTDTIARLAGQKQTVAAFTSPDPDIARGVNTRAELSDMAQMLQARILHAHMLAGVTIEDPRTTHIDAAVRIGADTTIRPFSLLTGVTDIGGHCEIGPGARISDALIGAGVSVRDSYVTASDVGDGCRIGPYANIRPGCKLGANVKIGDFVELKNATLADGVSASHLAYLGDAAIGERANIGAGAITCNYDGENKHRTVIGAEAFVGTNSTLVAPVTIGDGAYTAAGSVITDTVPDGALGIGRARQVNKDGWAAKKRRKG